MTKGNTLWLACAVLLLVIILIAFYPNESSTGAVVAENITQLIYGNDSETEAELSFGYATTDLCCIDEDHMVNMTNELIRSINLRLKATGACCDILTEVTSCDEIEAAISLIQTNLINLLGFGFVDHTLETGSFNNFSEIPFFNETTFFEAAGLPNGFRRASSWDPGVDDWTNYTDPMYTYGNSYGSLIGPWLFEDLKNALETLNWTKIGVGGIDGWDYIISQAYSDSCSAGVAEQNGYWSGSWTSGGIAPYMARESIEYRPAAAPGQEWDLESYRLRSISSATVPTIAPCEIDSYYYMVAPAHHSFYDIDGFGISENRWAYHETMPAVYPAVALRGGSGEATYVGDYSTNPLGTSITCPNTGANGIQAGALNWVLKWEFPEINITEDDLDESNFALDRDGDGWYDLCWDCNDTNPAVHPDSSIGSSISEASISSATSEVCDGIDNNCAGHCRADFSVNCSVADYDGLGADDDGPEPGFGDCTGLFNYWWQVSDSFCQMVDDVMCVQSMDFYVSNPSDPTQPMVHVDDDQFFTWQDLFLNVSLSCVDPNIAVSDTFKENISFVIYNSAFNTSNTAPGGSEPYYDVNRPVRSLPTYCETDINGLVLCNVSANCNKVDASNAVCEAVLYKNLTRLGDYIKARFTHGSKYPWNESYEIRLGNCPFDSDCKGDTPEEDAYWDHNPLNKGYEHAGYAAPYNYPGDLKFRSCELYEVCHPGLDRFIDASEDYCSDGTAFSGLTDASTELGYKKCLAFTITEKGLGPPALWMDGYWQQELECRESMKEGDGYDCDVWYFSDSYYLNPRQSYFLNITGTLPLSFPTWKNDTDYNQNHCHYHDLPAHASLYIVETGTCVDYSVAVTTMFRKAGYPKDEVYSYIMVTDADGSHAANLIKHAGDYWVVDNNDNEADSWISSPSWSNSYFSFPYCRVLSRPFQNDDHEIALASAGAEPIYKDIHGCSCGTGFEVVYHDSPGVLGCSCSTNSHCQEDMKPPLLQNSYPFCLNQKCVQCLGDSDCDAGETCNSQKYCE